MHVEKNLTRICIFILVIFSGSCKTKIEDEKSFDTFYSQLKQHIAYSQSGELTFESFNSIKWDEAICFFPYTPIDTLRKFIKKNEISDGQLKEIQLLDDKNLWVFFNDSQVNKYVYLEKRYGDLQANSNYYSFNKDSTLFTTEAVTYYDSINWINIYPTGIK